MVSRYITRDSLWRCHTFYEVSLASPKEDKTYYEHQTSFDNIIFSLLVFLKWGQTEKSWDTIISSRNNTWKWTEKKQMSFSKLWEHVLQAWNGCHQFDFRGHTKILPLLRDNWLAWKLSSSDGDILGYKQVMGYLEISTCYCYSRNQEGCLGELLDCFHIILFGIEYFNSLLFALIDSWSPVH